MSFARNTEGSKMVPVIEKHISYRIDIAYDQEPNCILLYAYYDSGPGKLLSIYTLSEFLTELGIPSEKILQALNEMGSKP